MRTTPVPLAPLCSPAGRRRLTAAAALLALALAAHLSWGATAVATLTSAAGQLPPPTKRDIYLQDVAWSPDGRWFAFSRYAGEGPYDGSRWAVWVADRDGGEPRRVLSGAVYIGVSPDGRRLASYLPFDGDLEVVTVAVDGSALRRLTHRPGKDKLPSFSPDGRTLVYSAEVDGNFDLYEIPVAGGTARRLTTDPAADYNPVYSPDGRQVVFYREQGDRHDQVWVLERASGRGTRITDGTGHHFFPFFLPDGRIGYSGQPEGGERRLYVTDHRGRSPQPVGPAGIFFARWSPDGREVLFLVQKSHAIWLMAADGSGARPLLDVEHLADVPSPPIASPAPLGRAPARSPCSRRSPCPRPASTWPSRCPFRIAGATR